MSIRTIWSSKSGRLPVVPPSEAVHATEADRARTFMGYRRADGRAGTRNFIGILASVNCSATVCHAIADEANRTLLPQISGDRRLRAHRSRPGLRHERHRRRHDGAAPHACRLCPSPEFRRRADGRSRLRGQPAHPLWPEGRRRRENAISTSRKPAARANLSRRRWACWPRSPRKSASSKREPIPVSEIVVGLQCGGSDGMSGITANPALGAAVDILAGVGGIGILSETTEIYGAEHLLALSRGDPGDRRQARRLCQMVGGPCCQAWRLHRQQSFARQQARRPDHHSGEVAWRRRQGRPDAAQRRLRLCREGQRTRLGVHGHARLRSGFRHRPGGRRRQRHRLHHRPRFLLRLPADTVDQGRQQLDHVPHDGRGHGRRIAASSPRAKRPLPAWAARFSS